MVIAKKILLTQRREALWALSFDKCRVDSLIGDRKRGQLRVKSPKEYGRVVTPSHDPLGHKLGCRLKSSERSLTKSDLAEDLRDKGSKKITELKTGRTK